MQDVTQTQGQISKFQSVWKSIQDKGPFIILLRGTVTENGKEIPRIYGAFVQGKVPKCPAEMYDVEGDFPIHQT